MRIRGIVATWLVAVTTVVWTPVARAASAVEPSQAITPGDGLDPSQWRFALVGSWQGTSGDNTILLSTFSADGTMTNDIQGEISTDPQLGVLTPLHGVWTYLGGRQFGVTALGVFYDINTGAYLGQLKVRIRLKLNKAGDRMSGTDDVEIINPDGTITPLGSHTTPYSRIVFEPFD
jgi:hypothetical protein